MELNKVNKGTKKGAFIVLGIILVSFLIGFLVLKQEAMLMLIFGSCITGIYAYIQKFSFEEMISAAGAKIGRAAPGIFILLSIGVMTGAWMVAGVIPIMIKLGLEILNPNFLLVTSFAVCAIVSLVTGTSWGCVSTIGVALMGVAAGFDLPLAPVAGAIVSGAYFGDKMSPLSDTTNISALAAKADLYDHIKQMLVTSVPAAIIAMTVFYFLGMSFGEVDIQSSDTYVAMIDGINSAFNGSILLFIPPLIVFGGAMKKMPTVPTLLLSAFVGVFIGAIVNGFTLQEGFNVLINGFNSDALLGEGFVTPEVAKLLDRGGIISMYGPAMYVVVAFTFGSMLEITSTLDNALHYVLGKMKSATSVLIGTGLTAFSLVAATQNSYISYFLTADMYGHRFDKLGLKRQNLSRILEDFVTCTEGLMPWTVSGVFMATTLGVSSLELLPYAVWCWACPMISIILAVGVNSYAKRAFAWKKEGER